MKTNVTFFLILSFLIGFSLNSCKKEENPVNVTPAGAFSIDSFSPDSVYADSSLTFFGHNFLSDSIKTVLINGISSKILSINNDTLVVKIPKISNGPAKIKIISKKDTVSLNKEIYIKPFLEVYSFSPDSTYIDSLVTFYGHNFLSDSVKLVSIKGVSCQIIMMSNDSLIVKVPQIDTGFAEIKFLSPNDTMTLSKKIYIKSIKIANTFDFSQIHHFNLTWRNLHGIIEEKSSEKGDPYPPTTIDTSYERYDIGYSISDSSKLTFTKLSKDEYQFSDSYLSLSVCKFSFKNDPLTLNFIYLNTGMSFEEAFGDNPLIFFMGSIISDYNDIHYEIINDSIIIVRISGLEYSNHVSNQNYGFQNGLRSGHYSSDHSTTVKQFLPATDSTSFTLKLYK
jgi:hypothetical protein